MSYPWLIWNETTEITPELLHEGFLVLLDKPLGWTSFQVVNKLRWALRRRAGIKKLKVGHAGTLDPLASGLLIIAVGAYTKRISEIQVMQKEYEGELTLGATRPSYDMETEIDAEYPIAHVNEELIKNTAQRFVGKVNQLPPAFSAIKKDGKRVYELARAGQEVQLEARPITIYGIELLSISLPTIHFHVRCSKGTYIRSLAHDWGKALGSGAYLSELKRTAIGSFNLSNAISIDSIERIID